MLFGEIAAKVAQRPGGYTRVIKLGRRFGDAADVAMIELVDYNTGKEEAKPAPKPKRARRTPGKKAETSKAEVAEQPAVEAAPAAEAPAAEKASEQPEKKKKKKKE